MLLGFGAQATHNRAGEITYTHVQGFTYEFVITTCTKTSVIADREWLKINWGDVPFGSTLDSLQRESIQSVPGQDAQVNTYRGTHTYSGPGEYLIQMADPNRNEGVHNIPNSVEQEFCVQSLLIINPQTGNNNSVQLLNPPKDEACLNKLWEHNPGAYDPDGDLITYSLVTPLGRDLEPFDGWNDPVVGYTFPDEATENEDDTFFIDPLTGTVTWDVPSWPTGEYNVAILIEEWREVEGTLIKVGHVIRDMQILVQNCPNNPPIVEQLPDTCIEAYTVLNLNMEANDPDGDQLFLEAIGGPLTQVEHPANFTAFSNGTGTFNWTPECAEIRAAPYQVLFKATDNSSTVDLIDYMTMNITVVAPAVENPSAEPDGNSIILNWDSQLCTDILPNNEIDDATYKIYRRLGSYGFEPGDCELGVPEYTGYELIGTVEGLENTSYVDTDGLFFGGEFCYMIVTCLEDGAESYASEEFCANILKDRPVLTNVDVNATDEENGEIYIAWSPAADLDTENFPGPYYYELYHAEGFSGASELIYTSDPNADLFNGDTTFVHTGLNTLTTPHVYRVNLWSGEDFVGSSAEASSIFLELEPGDEQMTLLINELVPWANTSYDVYRKLPDETEFTFLITIEDLLYTDEGIPNNEETCYYVQATGSYPIEGSATVDPILNDSQEACAFAVDLTPPCPPELTIEPICEQELAVLSFTNPNNACEKTSDSEIYNIYYAPTEGEDLTLFATLPGPATDSTFVWNEIGEIGSVAGCYAVTALDSLTLNLEGELIRNESEFSNVVCIDNCPYYFLPNVFSPNNDGVNDVFKAYPFRFVEDVEFRVFSRWGQLVYETNDPNINWNGTHFETGEVVADGTYFYTVKANTIRLSGIVPEEFSGTITLLDGKNPLTE